jgi:HSP20 family molecular chaperone IbpA
MNNYGFFPVSTAIFEDVERILNNSLKTVKTQYPTNIIDLFHKGYKIEIALAGFSKEDISVEVNGNKLDVNVSVPSRLIVNEDDGDACYIKHGISYREMSQSFNIGEKIDVSNISVEFVDGLLTINLPIKRETEINNRKIEIK